MLGVSNMTIGRWGSSSCIKLGNKCVKIMLCVSLRPYTPLTFPQYLPVFNVCMYVSLLLSNSLQTCLVWLCYGWCNAVSDCATTGGSGLAWYKCRVYARNPLTQSEAKKQSTIHGLWVPLCEVEDPVYKVGCPRFCYQRICTFDILLGKTFAAVTCGKAYNYIEAPSTTLKSRWPCHLSRVIIIPLGEYVCLWLL